jgi:predicted small secreted protein
MRIIAVLLLALALVACGGNTVQVGEDFYVGEDVRARVVDVEMDERGVAVTIEAENTSTGRPQEPAQSGCMLVDDQGREFIRSRSGGRYCIRAGNSNVVQEIDSYFQVAPDSEGFTLWVGDRRDEPPIAVLPLD